MTSLIEQMLSHMGYVGIALLMLAETIFPPVPSEVIMPLAGMQTARGPLGLAGVIAAGTAGAMVGNLFWYWVARRLGVDRFRRFVERRGRWLALDWNDVERGRRLFGNWGGAVVGLGRLVPTIRSIVSIPAGLLAMPFGRFFLWSLAGTTGWTALLAMAGARLGASYAAVGRFVGPVSTIVIALIAALYLWRIVSWRRRRS
ncbi:alkaline phosphatase [Sphingomonas melonis]|uniref:Alkaline phosphatase n=1 Tax=Sphingomonas melonis TaxID=152682 RepID=A0A0D1M5E2_9SPHN|nr:DedA family protein [Sphingomonas melonis]KIU26032.1 alkaline phosphatase [Sphingomonas melonis]